MTVSLEEQIAAIAAASMAPPEASRSGTEMTAGGRTSRWAWAVAAACLVGALAVGSLVALRDGESDMGRTEAPPTSGIRSELVGRPAPGLSGTTAEGTPVELVEMLGQWVVVELTASWCVPCRDQVPELVAASRAHPEVGFLSVVWDDDLGEVTTFLDAEGADWPVIEVPEDGLAALGATGVPTTYLIDPWGVVTAVFVGATATDLEVALARPSRPPATNEDDEPWKSNAVGHDGEVKGILQARVVELPGGRQAYPVERRGEIVGYTLVDGPIGYVDRSIAEDEERLAAVVECGTIYVETLTADARCTTVLAEIGVDTTPDG